jgi:ribosomal protein S18
MKTSLQAFAQKVESQEFFDSETGNIINVELVSHFTNDDGKLLASRYCFCRAYHQRKLITTETGKKEFVSDFWILPGDLVYAIDKEPFIPTEDGRDQITGNDGYDWEPITCVQCWNPVRHYNGKGDSWVRFLTGTILPSRIAGEEV